MKRQSSTAPGQRQSMSAASAIDSKKAFWFATYEGGLSGELFVKLLSKPMSSRRKAVRPIVVGSPAYKKVVVKGYESPRHFQRHLLLREWRHGNLKACEQSKGKAGTTSQAPGAN